MQNLCCCFSTCSRRFCDRQLGWERSNSLLVYKKTDFLIKRVLKLLYLRFFFVLVIVVLVAILEVPPFFGTVSTSFVLISSLLRP